MLDPFCRREGRWGGRRWSRRQLIDGMRFRVRTGVPWRDVPVEYGPWGRIYDLFRRWQRDGTWHQVLTRLQALADAKGGIVWDLSIESTVCRAHQHADGARKQGELQKEPRESPGRVFDDPESTGWGVRAAGSPPSCTWLSGRVRSHDDRGDGRAVGRLAAVRTGAGEGRCVPHRAGATARLPRPRAG